MVTLNVELTLQRTDLQNKSLHKYFELLAQALNDAGFTQDVILTHKLINALEALIGFWEQEGDTFYSGMLKETLERNRPRVQLSWTKESLKELWRTVQIAMTGKQSTTELTTGEVGRIYQDFDARIAEITGVRVEWPHCEE